MALEIRTFGDPVLREKCHSVEGMNSGVEGLARTMGDTLSAEPGRVGLAASQVGALRRLFVYDLGHGVRCFVNPEIVEMQSEYMVEEGCLSLPGILVPVPRYYRVGLRCNTLSGHRILFESEGFLAQVFQHECDHLEGVLIIDRCSDEERRRALEEYREIEFQRRQAGL
ncbi:MAG: peptide deformylase [Actinobacteria bacterium]|nr:peptide deformylase [Actinomycetota bacterium]MBU4240073.1 peptide deformylase [Actinomycetota bacterium]MBU4489418.1 peptide deformylase [Actinomycetota bacterium]MCG2796060.1 peptide deformylase [Actinomycetes bacterium]